MMRRWLCVLLILLLVFAMFPARAFAANTTEYRKSSIHVVADKDGKATEVLIPIVIKNDELYIQPEELTRITRYSFTADATRLIFRLGLKSVVIDTGTQTLQVNFTQQAFSGCLEVDNLIYLPMSELLPWLNVQCYEADGKLHIDSDLKSYWEVIADFDSTDYLFDFAENYGQTTGDVVGLCAISVFDCILDLDNIWKKVVTVGDGDTRLYDYEIYKECFREFALPETGTEAELQKVISELSGVVSDSSQFTNTCFEALYNEEMYGKLAERFGKDFAEGFDKLPTDAAQLTETLKLAKTALKYIKTGYLYTRIAMTDTTDYANALRHIYLEEDRTTPGGIELAASEAVVALESRAGAVADATGTMLADFGVTLLEKTAKSATEDAIKSAAGDTIFGSLGLYLDIVDTALTLVWPVNDAYSEITKMTVYQSIQYDALNAFYDLSKSNTSLNALDISNGRLSAIIFLKTAKKCYQAQQDTFDLFGGDGVLEYQINDINGKLLEFELSALAEERDAIEDKSTETEALKQLWNDGGFIKESPVSDTTALLGTWYLYQGGKQDAKGNWSEVAVYTLKLLGDGTAEIAAGIVQSEYYAGYTGTWSAAPFGEDRFQVQLNVTGGDLALGETLPQYACSLLVEVTIKNNILTAKKISGDDICLIYESEYERNLTADTWFQRQENSNSAGEESLFNETYWIWSVGPTNGTNYAALFHADGTFDYMRFTDGFRSQQTYKYNNGILTINNVEYVWDDGAFKTPKELAISSGTEYWRFSLTPDPDKKIASQMPGKDTSVWTEWETVSQEEFKLKCASLLEKILLENENIWDARVLISEDSYMWDDEHSRAVELNMIRVNDEWLSDYTDMYYCADVFSPNKVAFFLADDLGWTDIAWEYDWNGKLLNDNQDLGALSEDILSYFDCDS